jgi:hypothetical protein
VLAIVITVSLQACWFAKREDLPGRYSVEGEWGMATLELEADGTLMERVRTSNGESVSIVGKWSFSEGRAVVREPCLDIDNGGYHGKVSSCSSSVNWNLNRVHIALDPDYGMAYQK